MEFNNSILETMQTFNIRHSTFNIQHSTFDIQHSTFDIQHSTFNIQHDGSLNIYSPCFFKHAAVEVGNYESYFKSKNYAHSNMPPSIYVIIIWIN